MADTGASSDGLSPVAPEQWTGPWAGLVFVLVATWIVVGLVGHDPWKPDEAYTFGLVRDFVANMDFVVPSLDGEPFVEKPPLFYITAGGFLTIFRGILPAHDAARLATGFFVALALVSLGLTARELSGPRAALVAILSAAGCLGVVFRLHQLITDVALLTGMGIGLYGLAMAPRVPAIGGVVLGIGGSIAFLSKGLLGPGWLTLIALWVGQFHPWRGTRYWRTLVIALFIAASCAGVWMDMLWIRSPALFGEWLIDNNFGRFIGLVDLGPHNPRSFYFLLLPWFAFPALPLALLTLWQSRHRGRELINDASIVLPSIAALVIFVVLVSASDSRDLYALPIILPLALLAGAGADGCRLEAATILSMASKIILIPVSCLLVVAWAALLAGLPGPITRALSDYQPGFAPTFRWAPFLGFVAVATVALIALCRRSRDITGGLVHWLAGVTLCWGVVSSLWLGYLDAGKSYRGVFTSLRSLVPRADCLYTLRLGEGQRALVPYFAGVTAMRFESASAPHCTFLLVQGTRRDGAPAPDDHWAPLWQGARAGDQQELYRLYTDDVESAALAHYP